MAHRGFNVLLEGTNVIDGTTTTTSFNRPDRNRYR